MTGGVCRISLQPAFFKFAMGEGGSQKKAPGGTGGRRREKAMERTTWHGNSTSGEKGLQDRLHGMWWPDLSWRGLSMSLTRPSVVRSLGKRGVICADHSVEGRAGPIARIWGGGVRRKGWPEFKSSAPREILINVLPHVILNSPCKSHGIAFNERNNHECKVESSGFSGQ